MGLGCEGTELPLSEQEQETAHPLDLALDAVEAAERREMASRVEVVLEQLDKQEQRVAEMRKELAREERELAKLQQARKVLEAQ